MAFEFDKMYVKGNTVSHIDAVFRLEIGNEKLENHENVEDKLGGNKRFALKSTQNQKKSKTPYLARY